MLESTLRCLLALLLVCRALCFRLKMPLIKEPRWLFETTTRYLDDGLNNLSLSNITDKAHQDKVQQVLSYRLSAGQSVY